MQSTTCLHDGIANAILQEAYLVFDHPVAFHPANGGFNPDADRRDRTIGRLLQWGESPPTWFLLRLDGGDPVEDTALEAPILVEATAVGESLVLPLCQAFITGFAFIRSTQEADGTGLLAHTEVVARVALLLPTLVFLLVFGIGGAVDRSLRTIMPQRGGPGAPFVRSAAHCMAHSSAVRAGRSSWCAKA
jgi:hypothetical protein